MPVPTTETCIIKSATLIPNEEIILPPGATLVSMSQGSLEDIESSCDDLPDTLEEMACYSIMISNVLDGDNPTENMEDMWVVGFNLDGRDIALNGANFDMRGDMTATAPFVWGQGYYYPTNFNNSNLRAEMLNSEFGGTLSTVWNGFITYDFNRGNTYYATFKALPSVAKKLSILLETPVSAPSGFFNKLIRIPLLLTSAQNAGDSGIDLTTFCS